MIFIFLIVFFFLLSSMKGSLMQLVARRHPDIYLTGTPQITFWKMIYRRHTNFAIESRPISYRWKEDNYKK